MAFDSKLDYMQKYFSISPRADFGTTSQCFLPDQYCAVDLANISVEFHNDKLKFHGEMKVQTSKN